MIYHSRRGSEDMQMPVPIPMQDAMPAQGARPAPVNEIAAELPPQGTPQPSSITRTVIRM